MKYNNSFLICTLVLLLTLSCTKSKDNREANREDTKGRYELVADWPNLPEGLVLGSPAGLGLDTEGNLMVFHRSSRRWDRDTISTLPLIPENTISTIDTNTGEILRSWGKNLFIMPHGLEVDNENNIWVTDCGLHQVFKFDQEGNLLMTLGEARIPGSDSLHFNMPTDIAVTPDGSFYISDGYGNSRIIKFSKEGEFLYQWGEFGIEKGQFNTPHAVDLDKYGNVYVADRENNRIQKFDSLGNFINLWQNKVAEQLYSVTLDNSREHLFGVDFFVENDTLVKGSDIFRFDLDLEQQVQFGRSGNYEGTVARYHDIQIDRSGNIYTGDILSNKVQKFRPTASK
ncbi:peptidyl-alpha-hydroxyglycine alpha-amidating lyase family protein [Mangrovivirga sp. M17]|uniref:peptidylamidoglycolate lyase n=1 Tax=Mangrovivirga halotolerans TaxID=2993936 RepID=A0ABT3RU58_9BACT|nr:peptidyl-alpha-hydroxyglycine alpha-amidating lyase family protein [Mangrovivirga halotolerans]MCX2745316.1 peptidyl-alpha-hydroxyglycine alpha-amidating lyase family protein [Mangrovivirga halotolerans]